jgi:hypothetical protein
MFMEKFACSDMKDMKDMRDMRDMKDMKDMRDMRDMKDMKDMKALIKKPCIGHCVVSYRHLTLQQFRSNTLVQLRHGLFPRYQWP